MKCQLNNLIDGIDSSIIEYTLAKTEGPIKTQDEDKNTKTNPEKQHNTTQKAK